MKKNIVENGNLSGQSKVTFNVDVQINLHITNRRINSHIEYGQ